MSALGIELSKAEMAVGYEWSHAEFVRQGEGLSVVSFGLIALQRLALRSNAAEEAQGIHLVAAFLVFTGKRQCAFGEGVCLLQPVGEEMRLPQGEATERLMDHRSGRCATALSACSKYPTASR